MTCADRLLVVSSSGKPVTGLLELYVHEQMCISDLMNGRSTLFSSVSADTMSHDLSGVEVAINVRVAIRYLSGP